METASAQKKQNVSFHIPYPLLCDSATSWKVIGNYPQKNIFAISVTGSFTAIVLLE